MFYFRAEIPENFLFCCYMHGFKFKQNILWMWRQSVYVVWLLNKETARAAAPVGHWSPKKYTVVTAEPSPSRMPIHASFMLGVRFFPRSYLIQNLSKEKNKLISKLKQNPTDPSICYVRCLGEKAKLLKALVQNYFRGYFGVWKARMDRFVISNGNYFEVGYM